MAKAKSSRGELLDRAFLSAMQFRWGYRNNESREKAIARLRRRCPGFTPIQYINAFQKGTDLYNHALESVRANKILLFPMLSGKSREVPREVIEHLRMREPGFNVKTYKQAIGWVVYWHYLR